MQLSEDTRQAQSKLAAYCRTGVLDDMAGINKQNIGQYRRLVFNIMEDMLESAYPITRNFLSDDEWRNLVHDFVVNHPCQSPQVWYMPGEFEQYFAGIKHPLQQKYPFINDLLKFEWLEVELFMMQDQEMPLAVEGNINKDCLVLNPEHKILSLSYPVHFKNPNKISANDHRQYFLLGYRNRQGHIQFTDLAPALLFMLESLKQQPKTIKQLLKEFQQVHNIHITGNDQETILVFFQELHKQELILGFQPDKPKTTNENA